MSEPGNERLAWFLILAVALHTTLLVLRIPLKSFVVNLPSAESEPIEIEALKDTRKPVVQTGKTEDRPDLKDKKARFAGEVQNRVEEEMQSSRTGKYDPGKVGRTSPELPLDNAEGEAAPKEPSIKDLMAFGSNPHQLPDDVKKGGQTVLNTDKVLYASFINRVADDIYDVWVEYAQAAVKELYLRGRKLDANVYITKLKIVLDKEGELKSIQIVQSSGVSELDDAPKRAFWEREPFRHPPTQMFEEDGYARFVYEFHFEWKSSSFNIVPWEI